MQLQSLGLKPFVLLFVILAIGPLIAGFLVHRQAGSLGHGIVTAASIASSIAFLTLFGATLNRSVQVDGDTLTVKSTFYSTTASIKDISDIQWVSASRSNAILGMRTNGIGLPGFRSGWFSSKTGGRLFVDLASGDFLLISFKGSPAIALEFADPDKARRSLKGQENQ